MGRRKTALKVDVPEEKLDPKIAQILADLREGKLSKKEIANKNKVNLSVVCRVMKSDNFDPSQIKEQKEENPNVTVIASSSNAEQQTIEECEEASLKDIYDADDKSENRGDKMNKEKRGGYRSGPKAKLSDEKIIKMISDIEALETIKHAALQKIANDNGVSISSVYRYGREFGLIPEVQKREKKPTIKTKPIKKVNNKKKKVAEKKPVEKEIVVYHKANYEVLQVGMFIGRHEMPIYVNKFIFNRPISKNNLFDFEMMDATVEKFIKDNFKLAIDEDGVYYSDKEMILYLTGLSSALASIIKLTAKYNINLTLAHFNHETGLYSLQRIWDKPAKSNNPYQDIIGNYTTTTWYKCDYDDIKSLDKFYIVQVVNFSGEDKYDRESDVYIYAHEEMMWEHYYKLLTEVMSNRSKYLSIFVKTAHIKNEKIQFDTVIGRASNFDCYSNK